MGGSKESKNKELRCLLAIEKIIVAPSEKGHKQEAMQWALIQEVIMIASMVVA